jgi:probable rRNA maturation factor
MILFDPDQPEAASGFPTLIRTISALQADEPKRSPLPSQATLSRHLRNAREAVRLKGDVSLLLTTDRGIRSLNRRYRKKDKATDVLSFPAMNDSFPGADSHGGDLAISVETAARQAQDQGHSLSIELRVLMLHGLLHLAGYDHEADQGEMARKESRLRARLGLPQGLIERTGDHAAKPHKTNGKPKIGSRPALAKRLVTHPARSARP